MPSRIDGPKVPQNSLDNQLPEKIGKQKIWHGRTVQEKTQQKAKSAKKILTPTEETPTPRSLHKKKLAQLNVDKSQKQPVEKGKEPSGKKVRSKAHEVHAVRKKTLSAAKRQRSEEMPKEISNSEKKQKLEPKKESFLDSKIADLEAKYEKELQSLPDLGQRIYFEATKVENLVAEATPKERKGLEKKLGGSPYGQQLFITKQKIREYADVQPKDVQKVFQPILETLQRSKKCFLGMDVLYKVHERETEARIKEELAQSMEEAVKNTPVGGSTLIPAGYSMMGVGAHATPLVFTRISDAKGKLQIYNTGDGIYFHDHTDTIPIKIYPKVYLDVDINKLSKDFFTKIIRIASLDADENNKSFLPVMLSQTIQNELDILIDPSIASKKERPYYDQGPIGRCAYSPLSRYVHNALKDHEEEYAKYKLYTTAALVTQYSKQLNEEISSGSIHKIEMLSKNQFEKLKIIGEETLKDRKGKIEWISSAKRTDEAFMLDLVQKNGRSLRFGSEEIRKNIDIAKAAILNDPKAIQYVDPTLKTSAKFMKFAVEIAPELLPHADICLRNDMLFMLGVIKIDPERPIDTLQYASDELKKNPDFWSQALANSNLSKEEFAERVLMQAPSEYIDLIPFIKPLLGNPNFMLKMVQQKGSLLKYASYDLRNNKDIARAAVENNKDVLEYVGHNLREDPEFMLFALGRDPDILTNIFPTLWQKPDFLREVLRLNPAICLGPEFSILLRIISLYADETIKKDPSFWRQIFNLSHLSKDAFAEHLYLNASDSLSFAIDPALLNKLSDDRDFILRMADQNRMGVTGILKHTSPRLKEDRQFWIDLYGGDFGKIEYVSDAILRTDDPVSISHGLDPSLLNDPQYMLRFAELPHLLKYASDALKKNIEFNLNLVKRNPEILQFIDQEFRNNPEFMRRLNEMEIS